MLIFRQLFDLRSSTYTYLLADAASGEAVLIDPVFELFARDAALVRELGLSLRLTLETHVHADHVTGASLHREAFGSRIGLSAAAGVAGADVLLRDGDAVTFGAHGLSVLATPGHTASCLSFLTEDRGMVFTGDALMIRSAGRTDFQGGDARTLYRSVHERLFTLPDECLVYPGHDYSGRTCSSIGEEKKWNPRLGGERSEDDFVGYMENLGLPHPNQIDVAVPANMRAGRSEASAATTPAEWAPLRRSFAGVLEVEPEWLAEHAGEVAIVDVREPVEFTGELGHIDGARLIPLGELRTRIDEIARDRPIVAVCRSGARSAQATVILEKAGFARSANLNGCGMIRWRSLRLPVA